jgi:hypothetical protein
MVLAFGLAFGSAFGPAFGVAFTIMEVLNLPKFKYLMD